MSYAMKWKQPTGTPTYNSWVTLRNRCRSHINQAYDNYGGRGIIVCDRWFESYDEFYADMGERPKNMTIERINTDGNYEPGNCRWATRAEQNRNSRANRIIEFAGQKKLLVEWAQELGIGYDTLRDRFNSGMSVERALTPGTLRQAAQHGTRTKYNSGCRCEPCREVQRLHDRQRRQAA